jgi:lipopolysaccharide/colanic/teichoic acid biosynthesis glycosyltransferase
MTGLWQVSGRNRITDFDDIVRLDLEYIDSWSIWLDIRLIFRTIMVLFQKESAF